MRKMVESFKRLYQQGRLTKEQLQDRLIKKTITREEYDYIVENEV